MLELYVFTHLKCRQHLKRRNREIALVRRKRRQKGTKTLEKCEVIDEFKLEGDTIRKCKHKHRNIILEGCSDIEPSPPCAPDLFEKVKQRLFEKEQEEAKNAYLYECPQNILGVIGLDDWDFESILMGDDSRVTSPGTSKTGSTSATLGNTSLNELNTSKDFPTELLSGVFPPTNVCDDPHNNQMSFYKCRICNPDSYKDYEDWLTYNCYFLVRVKDMRCSQTNMNKTDCNIFDQQFKSGHYLL